MASKNELTRRSPAELRLLDRGPAALLLSGDCGGGERSVSPVPFVGSDNQGGEVLGLYERVVIGLGNLETATSVSRTGRYAAGPFGSGAKTVTVSWNLRSKSPSRFCKVPPRRLVKGKTVGAGRRLLRRAGLRPGGLIADWSARSVRPGRVTGYATGGPVPGARRCGSKVSI